MDLTPLIHTEGKRLIKFHWRGHTVWPTTSGLESKKTYTCKKDIFFDILESYPRTGCRPGQGGCLLPWNWLWPDDDRPANCACTWMASLFALCAICCRSGSLGSCPWGISTRTPGSVGSGRGHSPIQPLRNLGLSQHCTLLTLKFSGDARVCACSFFYFLCTWRARARRGIKM